ncbi:MAG: hypothetical protein WC868_06505 [Bacteroidales bacterium]
MTNKEQIKRDLAIAMDFTEHLIENPDMLDIIPDSASIKFLDEENTKPERPIEKDKLRKYIRVKRHFEVL